MSVVDDYGRHPLHAGLLVAACYPLRIRKTTDRDVISWLDECIKAGLIVAYTVSKKQYIEINDFRQRTRSVSKWPSFDGQMSVICPSNDRLDGDGDGDGDVSLKGDTAGADAPDPADEKNLNGNQAAAEHVLAFLNTKVKRNFQGKTPNGKPTANAKFVIDRLKAGYTVDQIRGVIAFKCRQWVNDPKMSEYLTPETLFSKSNFEKYIGQIPRYNEGE